MPDNKERIEHEIGTEKSAFAKAAGLEKAIREHDYVQERYTPSVVLGIDNMTAARTKELRETGEEKRRDHAAEERGYVEAFRDSPLRGGKSTRDLLPTGAGQAIITDDGVAGTDDPLDASTGSIDRMYDDIIASQEEELRRREYAKQKEAERQAAKERDRKQHKAKDGDER